MMLNFMVVHGLLIKKDFIVYDSIILQLLLASSRNEYLPHWAAFICIFINVEVLQMAPNSKCIIDNGRHRLKESDVETTRTVGVYSDKDKVRFPLIIWNKFSVWINPNRPWSGTRNRPWTHLSGGSWFNSNLAELRFALSFFQSE